jgi:exonuclease SbcD
MKILASGDHHFASGARFDECVRVHRWIADEVERQKPALFISGGDVFDRTSTQAERDAVADFLMRVASCCPVLIVKGNHDRDGEVAFMERLDTRFAIVVEERAGVHRFRAGGAEIAVAAVAWPSRAMLASSLPESSPEKVDSAGRDALRAVLRGLGQELASHDGPSILVGHFMIDGSVTSVGQPLIGAELNVGLADLALACADVTIAAHIHKPQEFMFDGRPTIYTGSPYRTSYGETEEKSITLLEFGERGLERWSRLPTPATGMELFEAEWKQDGSGHAWLEITSKDRPSSQRVKNADCRVRYRVPRDARDAARRAADALRDRMLADGAASVKLEEELVVTQRARAPEISTARTLEDKLDVLWDKRALDHERRARLREKLRTLDDAS